MKILIALLNNPLFVMLNAILGATALAYLEKTAWETFYWFVPCMFVILADLTSGIRSAKYRKEDIRISTAMRRTINKVFCYFAWIVCCVALNERYHTEMCAWVGMGLIFGIEGFSFVTNLLEPHGLKLSLKNILKVLGKKKNLEGLEEIVERKENTNFTKN